MPGLFRSAIPSQLNDGLQERLQPFVKQRHPTLKAFCHRATLSCSRFRAGIVTCGRQAGKSQKVRRCLTGRAWKQTPLPILNAQETKKLSTRTQIFLWQTAWQPRLGSLVVLPARNASTLPGMATQNLGPGSRGSTCARTARPGTIELAWNMTQYCWFHSAAPSPTKKLCPFSSMCFVAATCPASACWRWPSTTIISRSEEHTSELQSQSNLVCRLLLEKKKKKKTSSLFLNKKKKKKTKT